MLFADYLVKVRQALGACKRDFDTMPVAVNAMGRVKGNYIAGHHPAICADDIMQAHDLWARDILAPMPDIR